jgi:hypothetical protein
VFSCKNETLSRSKYASINNVEMKAKKETIMEQILLDASLRLFSCLTCSSTLKMGALYYSDIMVDFHWATWRYIPEKYLIIVTVI